MFNKDKISILTSEFPVEPRQIVNHVFYLSINLVKEEYIIFSTKDKRLNNSLIENQFDSELLFNVHKLSMPINRLKMYFNRFTFTALYNNSINIPFGRFLMVKAYISMLIIWPIILCQVGKSWSLASKKLKQGAIIKYID